MLLRYEGRLHSWLQIDVLYGQAKISEVVVVFEEIRMILESGHFDLTHEQLPSVVAQIG